MNEIRLTFASEADTAAFGRKLASKLFSGAFIALFGDLGAGKTTLAASIASALDIGGIQSPTFTIVREYSGKFPVFHFDAYRLGSADELYDIGFDDYLGRPGVIIMEWCENVAEALPPERLELHMTGSGSEPRTVAVYPFGMKHKLLCEDII